MSESKTYFAITASVTIIAAIIAGYTTAYFQTESLQEQITALEIRNDIQQQSLDDQEKQTVIMEQQLEIMQKNLEKESLISVKVLPQMGLEAIGHSMSLETLGYGNYSFSQKVIPKIIQSTDETNTIQTGSFEGIGRYLKPGDEPIVIEHSESISEMYGSSGELYFSVIYDNGLSEASVIKYKLKN